MQLSIITPEKTLFSAQADMVVVPGTEGDFGVLPGHMPFISTIRPGVITVDAEGQRKIAVIDGIAEVVPEHCIILAETARDITSYSDSEKESVRVELREARERHEAALREGDAAAQKAAGFTILLNEIILGEFNIAI